MILINSEGIFNIRIKNVLFAIRAHNNLNMSTSIIMNKLSNILKSLIFIVKSVHVWLQNLRMYSLLKKPLTNMFLEYIKKLRKMDSQ